MQAGNGTYAHLRGWDTGVEVTAGRTSEDRDVFTVTMTAGSHDAGRRVIIGTVTDTPDGPVWSPHPLGKHHRSEPAGESTCRHCGGDNH